MRRIEAIRDLVRNGLYYLTEHANNEAQADGFDIYDVEHAVLSGRIRRAWPAEGKYEIVGPSLDGRAMGVICRFTASSKIRVITVYAE